MISKLRSCIFRCVPLGSIVFSLVWLSLLARTDAYFSIYVIVAFLSFLLQVKHYADNNCVGQKLRFGGLVLSVVFSLSVLVANYPLFTNLGDPALISRSTSIVVNLINSVLAFVGGICVSYPVLCYVFAALPLKLPASDNRNPKKWYPLAVFLALFSMNMIHLFLVEYPGNVTEDPFSQIEEMVSGSYSNFNTFWHTMILRSVMSLGYGMSGDVNFAVALFCVFQSAIMCFAFTHCLMTMYRYGVPKAAIVVSFVLYGLLPYNLALSITIWKDVLFAGGCLLILSSWLRILLDGENSGLQNYLVFLLGSLLFILARTNGWLIYLVTFVVYALVIRKNRKIIAAMGVMAVIGWALLNPVLGALNVSGSDVVESLSIPVQQVSRVIAEGGELTEGETQLLSRVIDLEEVPMLYTQWISDPMKVELRSKDYDYFKENISEYGKLWLRLGIRYPGEYLKAWVEQTKGYWNAGYDYALYSETVTDNPYGVVKTGDGNIIASLFGLYFGLSRHIIFFEPLHSIGLHVWLLLLCFLLNIHRKREEWILCLPLALLVIGLWFGTPVYCCFRYAYPVFVSIPLLVSTAVYSRK